MAVEEQRAEIPHFAQLLCENSRLLEGGEVIALL